MKTCPRCERKNPALASYPVGERTEEICHDCWAIATGRAYQPPFQAPAQLSMFDYLGRGGL